MIKRSGERVKIVWGPQVYRGTISGSILHIPPYKIDPNEHYVLAAGDYTFRYNGRILKFKAEGESQWGAGFKRLPRKKWRGF